MAVISFSDTHENSWVTAGVLYRQVLEDVISQITDDPELAREFSSGIEGDGIIVWMRPPDLAARMTNAIRRATTGILSGEIRSGIYEKPFGQEPAIVEQYVKSLQRLADALPSRDS